MCVTSCATAIVRLVLRTPTKGHQLNPYMIVWLALLTVTHVARHKHDVARSLYYTCAIVFILWKLELHERFDLCVTPHCVLKREEEPFFLSF